MNVGEVVLQWLRSFLSDRSQKVVLGDRCSGPRPIQLLIVFTVATGGWTIFSITAQVGHSFVMEEMV